MPYPAMVEFQFHKGTSKTPVNDVPSTSFANFNSIKVQVKHLSQKKGTPPKGFQFHKGTSKTESCQLRCNCAPISIP